MSKTKAGGSTKNGRDSQAKRLGVKKFGGQIVKPGDIIVRQRGSHFEAGENVQIGRDYTIFATVPGTVNFSKTRKKLFTGSYRRKTVVNVTN